MRITGNQKLLAITVLTVAVLVIWTLRTSGPSYRGIPIREWFYHPDGSDAGAFRAMGQDAVPFLIRRLEDAPSERFKSVLEMLPGALTELHRHRKQMWQHRAAYLLGEMGSAARSAEANLSSAAERGNWALRGAATVALMKIRMEPIDPLIEELRDTSNWEVWNQNAMMVGQFGAQADSAVPILLDALRHSNIVIQAHALIALGWIGSQPDKCVPAIVPFVTSPNVGHRQKAMGALRAFGTNALPAKNSILGALNDVDPWVRHEAETALKSFPETDI
jgi:HEAT repeat protein